MTEKPVFQEPTPEDNRTKETENPYAEGMAELGKKGFVTPERFGQIVAAGHKNGIGTLDILAGARAIAAF